MRHRIARCIGHASLVRVFAPLLITLSICHPGNGQGPPPTSALQPGIKAAQGSPEADGHAATVDVDETSTPAPNLFEPQAGADDATQRADAQNDGFLRRGTRRILQDQREIYRGPFQPSSLKWDALVLAGTGALLATDRRIERHLPGGNVDLYTNASNIAIGGTAASIAVLWGYGLKVHNEHLKEMGSLEIEALINSFLIYTPMQVVAGRQRPGEGNGYGDFWRHHNVNTSFPAGHPMFTLTMASVVAHEYPKPWVQALAYGASAAVMGGRLLGRNHWSSDVFVGSALGYFIGARIFHSRCNPLFSAACHNRSKPSS